MFKDYLKKQLFKRYMLIFFILFSIQVTIAGTIVDYDKYNAEANCGDGIYDEFTEECDGTTGCGNDRLCKDGYKADNKGNCVVECVYGKACYSGCTAPNFCEICNISMGYNHDCQGCADGYMWNGVGNCVPIPSNKITCGSFFESIEDTLKDPTSAYYQNALRISKQFIHNIR